MKKLKNKRISKKEIALLLTILFSILFFFLYKYVLIFYFEERYDDVLFAYTSNYYSVIFFCGFIILGISAYFDNNRKLHPLKYWLSFACVGSIIFVLVGYFSTRGWVVTRQNIMYKTILSEDSVSYEYDDFKSICLYYNESIGIKGNGVSPEYKIVTNGGETITLCILESYYDSYENLIEFDKLVSNNRTCVGEYIYLSNSLKVPKELNQYYKTIFEESAET